MILITLCTCKNWQPCVVSKCHYNLSVIMFGCRWKTSRHKMNIKNAEHWVPPRDSYYWLAEQMAMTLHNYRIWKFIIILHGVNRPMSYASRLLQNTKFVRTWDGGNMGSYFITCKVMTHGARLTKTYDVTIRQYRNSDAKIEDSKLHILCCKGSKFCMKFQSALWNFTENVEPIQRSLCSLRGVQNVDNLWYLRVMTS